ncbi:MAG: hypothetical protein HDS68_00490 [Bacteroidales bacterium]|nr:hypothetical protein [Bacteroidales bacterium]
MRYRNICMAVMAAAWIGAAAADVELQKGDWLFAYDSAGGNLTLSRSGNEIFKNVTASVVCNLDGSSDDITIATGDVAPEVTVVAVSDEFGDGEAMELSFRKDGVTMTQSLALYDAHPYFIAKVTVTPDNGGIIHSGYMVPFALGDKIQPFSSTSNRILWVPFDNDGHGAYDSFAIRSTGDTESVSHEVNCVYNSDDRFGLVAGSVDHDNWKSGVTITGRLLAQVSKFECLSGLSNYFTRDMLPHGKVKGTSVSSARFMVGAFDDWREGMDQFAAANAIVAPRQEWAAGNPVGWSSWGTAQTRVNFDGVVETARFIRDELSPLGFHGADGKCVISLDAFGEDNIPAMKMTQLSKNVLGDGTTYTYQGEKYDGVNMTFGLYGGPFCSWDWVWDGTVEGTGKDGIPSYKNRDMLLKVNGEPYKLPCNGAYATDPTHPAMEALIKAMCKKYAERGARYVKIDFMNCGIIQGDSYYNPDITTAVQAYSYGMKILREEAAKYDMYLVLAMSPAFPYEYVHGRRTCCDRFSTIGESEYVMNATSYGWWMDKLYSVCDPDQLVMMRNDYNQQETDGENRVRATTGMTTGAYLWGDNFTDKITEDDGSRRGNPEEARRRALYIMGNSDINEYVRTHTGCFMPVEGKGEYKSPNTCETTFVRHCPEADYVAVFNFSSTKSYKGSYTFERLGVNPDTAGEITELWFGTEIAGNGGELSYDVPAKDVRVYRIANTSYSGIEAPEADALPGRNSGVNVIFQHGGGCNVKSAVAMRGVRVYTMDGILLGEASVADATNEISFATVPARLAIVEVTFADGTRTALKTAAN